MPKRSEFLDHVVERLRLFGPVTTRRMFGGWGIYREGLFFALIAGETLYFKTDDQSRAQFERSGPGPFAFDKKGERIVTHYYAVPEAALDDPAVMAHWARLGYAAALRAAKAPKRPRKRSRATPRS
jgi:DNA transformation protein